MRYNGNMAASYEWPSAQQVPLQQHLKYETPKKQVMLVPSFSLSAKVPE